MEVTNEIEVAIKTLGYTLEPITEGEVYDLVPSLGYESYDVGYHYPDGTTGVLMRLPEKDRQYNNGVYMLRKMTGGEVVMEVIIPNTASKGDLIYQLVNDIVSHIAGLNMEDMTIYNHIEMWGHIISKVSLHPLAQALYPNDKAKADRFEMLYLPRMLSNMAHIKLADDPPQEEMVDTEPYVLKMMIDQETQKDQETQETEQPSD